MSTSKQQQALANMVENGGNTSRAMRDAGYSSATAKTPSKLTGSNGFKELLNEYGLTDDLLITSLVADITGKPGNRKTELELAFKLKGYMNKQHEKEGCKHPPISLVEFI